MYADTDSGAESHSDAGEPSEFKSSLDTHLTTTFQLVIEPGLWRLNNPALHRLLGPARRVVVVHDDHPSYREAKSYLAELARREGITSSSLDGRSLERLLEREAVQAIVRFALSTRLDRRDAFLSLAGPRLTGSTALAATMFRRYSHAVRVHVDLLSLLGSLRQRNMAASTDGSLAAHQRHTVVVVDADAIAWDPAPLSSGERIAVQHLARFDEELADALQSAGPDPDPAAVRRGALEAIRRLFVQFGPGRMAPWDPVVGADRAPTGGVIAAAGPLLAHEARPVSYPVVLTTGVLDPDNGDLLAHLPLGARVAAIVDDYSPQVTASVRRWLSAHEHDGRLGGGVVLPIYSSPLHKTFDDATALAERIATMRLGPGDRIVAVGGGTVLDLVGHATAFHNAATPYVRVPTTLVGLVDAGIGLKVGVDVDGRKSLVGAYHSPAACLCDPSFLATLAPVQYRCGLAEIIKIALVCDGRLFELVERHHAELLAQRVGPVQTEMLRRAIAAMLSELEQNPLELHLRRLPDFGHEFGHVLEERSGFRLPHGEAVSIGMALSCQLAVATGRLAPVLAERVMVLLQRVGLPVYASFCDSDELWRALHENVVPHKGGQLHLVVPTEIGHGGFIDSIDELTPEMLADAWDRLRQRAGQRP